DSFYRALVHEGSDVVMIHDEHGHCTYVSPTIDRVLGWTPEHFAEHASSHIFEEDLAGVVELATNVLATPGNRLSFELRFQHADGSWRWFELRAINMIDVPAVHGIMSNLRDITERKDAEDALRVSGERFRAIVENTSDVVQIIDADGIITWSSPAVQ